MGKYLNPGNQGFRKTINSEIYVDKTGLIAYTNKVLDTRQQYICVSRPRRFGKSMAAEMLAAYYGRECDSKEQFQNLAIAKEEMKCWYDGYYFDGVPHIYSPKSVVEAVLSKCFDNFWNQTETYEALKHYIVMNYDGLRDTFVELLAGGRKKINTNKFMNDMTTFSDKDDVLTLLIHLGYLGYSFEEKEVFIPNSEVATEFYNLMESAGWEEIIKSVGASEKLLQAIWNREEDILAKGMEEAHLETSILTYNADTAIKQIKDKRYVESLKDYTGELLLVGINYEKETKKHECVIEEWVKENE